MCALLIRHWLLGRVPLLLLTTMASFFLLLDEKVPSERFVQLGLIL